MFAPIQTIKILRYISYDVIKFRPAEVSCGADGWSHETASCDATNGGLTPGAQVVLIVVGLGLLCGGTFLWQKYKKRDPTSKF